MPNYDGQYEVRIIYDCTPTGFLIMEHTLTFDVLPTGAPDPGDEFSTISIETRKADVMFLSDAIDDFVAGMAAIYSTASTIIRAELWYIPEGTFAGTFISTYPIDTAGTAVSTANVAQQMTMTFRSIGGGSGRLQFMEPVTTGNGVQSYPYSPTTYNAIADLVTGDGGFIIARDNTFMFANIHLNAGQNERLFRKRFRS